MYYIDNIRKKMLVSPEDEYLLHTHSFYKSRQGYAVTNVWYEGKRKTALLHKMIMPLAKFVDHINRDKMDNRRESLREATFKDNIRNKGLVSSNTTGYKGVNQTASGKWMANIGLDGAKYYLGSFERIEDAAQAYDAAALKYHGEFAVLNNVKG